MEYLCLYRMAFSTIAAVLRKQEAVNPALYDRLIFRAGIEECTECMDWGSELDFSSHGPIDSNAAVPT
jgi:hypothetical protein